MSLIHALPLIVFTLLPLSAQGRLGETEGQSQQRYGQPREDLTGPNDKPLLLGAIERAYEYQGWRVRAAFANGACVRIEYVHLPDNGMPRQITDAEMAAILDAEKGKFTWREEKATKQPGAAGEIEKALKGAFKVRKWQRSDRSSAEFALGLVLKLETRDAEDIARKLAKQAKDKPKIPGPPPNVPKF